MIDKEQAGDFIDKALSKLEMAVDEKNLELIKNNGHEFKNLISDYGRIIGKKNINNYFENYNKIMKKGGYLK